MLDHGLSSIDILSFCKFWNIPFFCSDTYLLPPANEVWGKVIFTEACVSHSVEGVSLHDVTSCLAT